MVKDVGWSGYVPFAPLLGGNPPISVRGGIDLHITETGMSLSPTDGTALVLNGPDAPNVAFTDVRNIRVRKTSFKGHYVLTLSYYKGGRHWWNTKGIGKVILNESQFAQVEATLTSVSTLKNKLNIG